MSEEPVEKKGFAEGFWSKEEIAEIFLEQQRKVMWNKDYWKTLLVPLFQLKQNSVILDVGCGLGFLEQHLAEFVPHGKIIGVDLDAKLIDAARKVAENSELGRVFDFRVGNAYELPADSDSVDLAICQCVLMHLEDPARAVSEMRRVTRRGGSVVAMEPDYAALSVYDTAFEKMGYSLDDRANFIKWEMMRKAGKRKLGKGDDDIGTKMPYLFSQNGLKVKDVRCLDRIFWLIPPYEQEGNDIELKQALLPPEFFVENLDMHAEFMAGGGTEEEFETYLGLLKKEHAIRQQQVNEKIYSSIVTQALIITIGEKI